MKGIQKGKIIIFVTLQVHMKTLKFFNVILHLLHTFVTLVHKLCLMPSAKHVLGYTQSLVCTVSLDLLFIFKLMSM